jgi:exosortase family protein XrtF
LGLLFFLTCARIQRPLEIIKKYRPVWLFILKFFGLYIVGVLIYRNYLNQFDGGTDGITLMVTEQAADLLSLKFDDITTYSCETCTHSEIRILENPFIYMIEGCNSVSVMLLFVAFVFAFSAPVKHYFWFIPVGLASIYITNLARIFILGIVRIYYFEYFNAFHDYVFPAIIYGMVVVLWIVWVKYFSNVNA